MQRVKVKMLDSIAGLPDPRPTEELNLRYERWRASLATLPRPPAQANIELAIGELKKKDRFGETPIGFAKDWSFKPGDEALINVDLAAAWETSGLCIILTDEKRLSA